ncbi:MAG: ABC transporter permease [Tissierella sp.]|nr:ABC transporter permease [Tissierella sp.]
MDLREIAKVGLKGRKKDTLLLKIVIVLAFVFIVTSIVFQGSVETTKLEQRLDLYGDWHAAYLQGNAQVLDRLKTEKDIDSIGVSTIIGVSEKAGVIGTFNEELLEMGRMELYKGRYPQASDEIMVELNQISDMGLDLEVGQKIEVELVAVDRKWDLTEYVESLKDKFDERWIIENGYTNLKYNTHHNVPFEKVGEVLVVMSANYIYVSPREAYVSPEMLIDDGGLISHKLILKKEFTITGILNTYSDKWDSNGFTVANSFITEEGGQEFTNAIYNNSLGDFSYLDMKSNIYLRSDALEGELFPSIKDQYPNMVIEDIENDTQWMVNAFVFTFGRSEEERQAVYDNILSYSSIKEKNEGNIEGGGQDHSKMEMNTSNFRRNNFSYPDKLASTEYVLTLSIIAIIFITTALAIFQIFLTQMRRRARKIVLLKSIGATNSQIVKMIAYEGFYLLRTGILIGLPTGLGFAALIIYIMNKFGGRNIDFHIIPSLLILGIIAGILALLIGMAVPVIYAVRIPLVGTMSKPPKHKKISQHTKKSTLKRQTFNSINLQYYKQNRGKTLITFGLSLTSIVILTTTILLCYLSFDNYREVVRSTNRPDYAMETYYGEMTIKLPKVQEELLQLEGIKKAEPYKVGRSTLLWYDGIGDNKFLNDFKELLPMNLGARHFTSYNNELVEQEPWIHNAFYTKYYGIDGNSEIFDRFESQLTVGRIDKEKFHKGDEVILLIPMYLEMDKEIKDVKISSEQLSVSTTDDNRMAWIFRNNGRYDLSYSNRYADYYRFPEEIKHGDTIYLSADEEKIEGDSRVTSYVTKEVQVGGIIHYFPEEGVWPFSNSMASYVVVGSYNGMESIYPNSRNGLLTKSLSEMKSITDTFYPNGYGRTIWYLDTDSQGVDRILDAKLLTFANENGYTLFNYKASNAELYHEALNNAIIIGLLGITASAIACVILYNTTVSKLEQDKNRIGILQALGVTKEQFSNHYLKLGIITGIGSMIITHIILFIVLLLTSIGLIEGVNMSFVDYVHDIFVNRLWLYPWFVHVIVCIVYLIITIFIYYLPNKKVTNLYPVENIRSLGR